jgi:hypothetical protein
LTLSPFEWRTHPFVVVGAFALPSGPLRIFLSLPSHSNSLSLPL